MGIQASDVEQAFREAKKAAASSDHTSAKSTGKLHATGDLAFFEPEKYSVHVAEAPKPKQPDANAGSNASGGSSNSKRDVAQTPPAASGNAGLSVATPDLNDPDLTYRLVTNVTMVPKAVTITNLVVQTNIVREAVPTPLRQVVTTSVEVVPQIVSVTNLVSRTNLVRKAEVTTNWLIVPLVEVDPVVTKVTKYQTNVTYKTNFVRAPKRSQANDETTAQLLR